MIDFIQNKEENKRIPCLRFARVCGYFSCVDTNWNPGKREEFKDRKTYNPNRIAEDCSEYI